MRESASSNRISTSPLSVLAHIGFVVIGIVNTMLGPLLPLLKSRWGMDDAQAGALLAAQSIGAILCAAALGVLVKRFGFRRLLTAGFVIMAVSLLVLALSDWRWGLVATFFCGTSLGLTIPTLNLLISELHADRREAALNILNLAWGVGATISPLFFTTLARNGSPALPLLILAALVACLSTAFFFGPAFEPARSPDEPTGRSSTLRNWFNAYALLTGALIFFNVGTESAMGGWLSSYARRMSEQANDLYAVTQSLFWGGLLAGRAVAPIFLRRLAGEKLILFSLLLALAGETIVFVNHQPALISLGACIAGFGLAPVFPTKIALFTRRFGVYASQMAGILFVLAGLGAAVIPWLIGRVSTTYADLRVGMVIVLITCGIVFALQAGSLFVTRQTAEKGRKGEGVKG